MCFSIYSLINIGEEEKKKKKWEFIKLSSGEKKE